MLWTTGPAKRRWTRSRPTCRRVGGRAVAELLQELAEMIDPKASRISWRLKLLRHNRAGQRPMPELALLWQG